MSTQHTTEGETMSKAEYIAQHPKSALAHSMMACNTWPDETNIVIVGGLDGRDSNRGNLVDALRDGQDCERGGHRWRGTEGWWWAVTTDLTPSWA